MNNLEQNNAEIIKIQGTIDRFLNVRAKGESHSTHLDEDTLNAFIEGNLAERETAPIIKHLIDCSFCLKVTSELFKLEEKFAGETISSLVPASGEPARISEVLQNLISRIFGTSDSAALAYQEEEKTEDKDKDSETKSS